jgi:hypothetical protein
VIPTAWKIGGALLLAALVVGSYFAWAAHEKALGAAAIEVADAKAVADQKTKDAALSADLVAQQEAKIRTLEASAQQVREVIRYVPVTNSCGPAVGNAADWVRGTLAPQAGGPPAGR